MQMLTIGHGMAGDSPPTRNRIGESGHYTDLDHWTLHGITSDCPETNLENLDIRQRFTTGFGIARLETHCERFNELRY